MSWENALDFVVEMTGHERYRVLCAEDHPDHRAARNSVLVLGGFEPVDWSAPADGPTAADLALRAHVASKGCGCGGVRA